MKTVTLYHGTINPEFTGFAEGGIGKGGDTNSSLGVFFCERPYDAIRYAHPDYEAREIAHPDGKIIVIEAELSLALVEGSISTFLV